MLRRSNGHDIALAETVALEAPDDLACRRRARPRRPAALLARQRVQLAAHQHERAVG